jgi:CHRD domain
MRPLSFTAFRAAMLCVLATAGLPAAADRDDDTRFDARLRGYQEVPTISTVAQGRFRAVVDKASLSLHYELSYEGLEGDVRMAHIHLGTRGINGGIMVWLCQTTSNPDPSGVAPMCPASGKVTGIVQASAVVGPAAQGVEANAFEEFVAAMRAGAAYVNVHSSKWPAGEIRGQIRDKD